MAKYRCILCGYVFDELIENKMFMFLDKCPSCGESSHKLKLIKYESFPESIKYYNAIDISKDNVAIERDYSKCIDCGLCKETCKRKTRILDIDNGKNCINCGNCVLACPVHALKPKSDIDIFKQNINKKKCFAYVAPASRATIGEALGLDRGLNCEGKLISLLRKIGFNYVLDLSTGADLTVIEEANELAHRIKYNNNLPMLTSCCPSWIKYVYNFHPELINNLSTCKSPLGMEDAIIKNYYRQVVDLTTNEIFTVAIVPCTSKKYEKVLNDDFAPDAVLTISELSQIISDNNIDVSNLEDGNFDQFFSMSSTEGTSFGFSGGVCEAVVKTAYKILTGEDIKTKLEFSDVIGSNKLKELTIDVNGFNLKVLIVNGIRNVNDVIDLINSNRCNYHLIEVMTCEGGCINGGGNPLIGAVPEKKVIEQRTSALKQAAKNRNIDYSYNNPDIIRLYRDYLEYPGSPCSNNLLHRYYINVTKDEE